MQPILEVKIILMVMMVLKIIEYSNQCTNILKKTGDKVSSWKSKGLHDEKIISTTTSTDKSSTKTIYDNARIKVKFIGDLLRQNQVTYNHGSIVNIYIIYRTTSDTKTSSIVLENCLLVQLN